MDPENPRIKRSLRYSVTDGAFYSVMVGFGESFFSAFAVFMQATNVQLGILGSLPQALGSLGQAFSTRLLDIFRTRKKAILIAATIQALTFLPMLLMYFTGTLRVSYFIAFVCLYFASGMLVGPLWTSWMGDLVDESIRGRYFGNRNKIAGLVTFISFIAAGAILQYFSNGGKGYFGFVLLFCFAFLCRMISVCFLAAKYEPPFDHTKTAKPKLGEFIKDIGGSNYGNLMLYLVAMNFFVFVAGPFFAAYMLKDLQMSYWEFTIANAAAIIVKSLLMPAWGKMCDRFGSRKVLIASGLLMPSVPLLWMLSPSFTWVIIVQCISGFAWAGFEIASSNFLFETTTPEKRTAYVAYYNVFNGVAILLGAITGGYLVRHSDFFWSKFYIVFLISFIGRYAASIVFLPLLKEVRSVERVSYQQLMVSLVTTTMPTYGLIHRYIPGPQQAFMVLGEVERRGEKLWEKWKRFMWNLRYRHRRLK